MSDAYPLPKNIPQGPQALPTTDPQALEQNLPGLPQMVASRVANSPSYQALKGQPNFGPAGLVGAASIPGAAGVAGAAAPLAGLAASAAPLAAAAYGVGKLVAPQWTDETVGKIKDYIAQKVPQLYNQTSAVGSSYLTGMAEAIPGSQFLEKKILPQQVNDYLSTIKNNHPIAAKAGRIGGTVGLMALPGINAIQGAGFGATVGNAALNALPYATGIGLDVGATENDVKKGVLAGLGSEVLGTSAPAAVSVLSKIPAVGRFLQKLQLSGSGISTRDLSKTMRSYAKGIGMPSDAVDSYAASNTDKLVNEITNLLDESGGIAGKSGKAAIKKMSSSGFEAHNKLYNTLTDKKIGPDDIQSVLADQDLSIPRQIFGNEAVDAAVSEMAGKIDGQEWGTARNNILPAYQKAGNSFAAQQHGFAADDPRILKSAVADAWRDRLDSVADRAMEWAKAGELGPEAQQAAQAIKPLRVLKATYPAVLSITKSAAREESALPKAFESGSDTFARLAMDTLLKGGATATGAALAGIPGAVAANIGGRVLSKAAGKAMEKGTGALASLLRRAGDLNTAPLGRLAAETEPLAAGAQGPTMPTGGTLSGPSPDQVQPVPAPAGPSQIPSPEQAPAPPGAEPIPNALPGQVQPVPIPPAAPQLSPQDQAQAQFTDAGKPQEPAKVGPWNSTFVNSRIHEKYIRHIRQYGQTISEDQYRQAVLSGTNNLNPLNPTTWKGMFDDPATADRYFNAYVNLQKIKEVDPASALNHYTRLFQLGPRIAPAEQFKENEDNAKLVDALAKMTGQSSKDIDSRLRLLAWDKGKTPEQKKQAVLKLIVNEGGVDVPLLVKMGLW